MARKDGKYFPIKLNNTKQRELIEKKSNFITADKSSYHLKSNLFSRPSEASLSAQWFPSQNI